MNFTNIDCVKNCIWYQMDNQVWDQVLAQVDDQVYVQVYNQVFHQIRPIQTKIKKEISKWHFSRGYSYTKLKMNFTNTDRVGYMVAFNNLWWQLRFQMYDQVDDQAKWQSKITQVRRQFIPIQTKIKEKITQWHSLTQIVWCKKLATILKTKCIDIYLSRCMKRWISNFISGYLFISSPKSNRK